MSRRPLPDAYWLAIADAYESATGTVGDAVASKLEQLRGRPASPSSAQNAIYHARKRGFIDTTQRGRASAGWHADPIRRLAEQLGVSTDSMRIACDEAGVQVRSRVRGDATVS